MSFKDSRREIVVCKVENTYFKLFLSHGYVLDNFLHILFVGKEKSIQVSGIRSVEVNFNLSDKLSEILNDTFRVFIGYFVLRAFK